MAPRLVDIKTQKGEEKITTIRREAVQISERRGEPVLISTIDKGTKLISQTTLKQKDLLAESFQRIVLLSMENQRLVSKNNSLEQTRIRLESMV